MMVQDDVEQVELCPICFAYIPVEELQQHVELHIETPTRPDQHEQCNHHVHCDECSSDVPMDEWDSHCLAHRYAVGTNAH